MTKESDLKKMRNKGDIRGLGKVAQREKDQRLSSMAASMLTDMVLDGYNRQTMFELFASLLERPHLRACAIIGLGRLKDPRAVDLLINASKAKRKQRLSTYSLFALWKMILALVGQLPLP
jgi:hypothetical protein